jgi:hypothetical protein
MKRAVLSGIITFFLFSGVLVAQSPMGSGRVPFGSYFDAGVDSINLYNGNVMLDIPLFDIKGRELSTGLRLIYGSQGWVSETGLYGSYYYYSGGFKVVRTEGLDSSVIPVLTGCSLDEGAQLPVAHYDIFAQYVDETNAGHEYGPLQIVTNPREDACDQLIQDDWDAIGQYWLSGGRNDSTMALLENEAITIYMPDGRIITPASGVETRNGNFAYRNLLADLLGDTLDRSMSRTHSSSTDSDQYTIYDFEGNGQHYTLHFDGSHAAYNPHDHAWEYIRVLTSIDLPNERSYSFEYGHHQGFLTKVTLPSGGYISGDSGFVVGDHAWRCGNCRTVEIGNRSSAAAFS